MQSSILTGHAETTDVDELAILLSDWSQHYQQITPGAFSGSMKHVRFEGLQLFRETTSQRIHQAGTTAPSTLTFAMPIALSEPVRWRGLMADADDMVCIWGGQEIDICNARHCDLLGVSVDLEEFSAYAEQAGEHDLLRLHGAALLKPAAQVRQAVQGFLVNTLDTVMADAVPLGHAQAQKALRESVHASLLALLTQHDAFPPSFSGAHARQLVGQARAYLREHREEVTSVKDMCELLGVSQRTLQYAFQDVLGINPHSYFRAIRLNSVRRDLKHPAPDTAVLDVAARWGFWHPSHFSADYKRRIGELPSMTLRRAQGLLA